MGVRWGFATDLGLKYRLPTYLPTYIARPPSAQSLPTYLPTYLPPAASGRKTYLPTFGIPLYRST